MDSQLAHDIYTTVRTEDVCLLENVSFRDMFFSEPIFKSLSENGFHKPSPIQYKAIPLARCGFDLIVQSKSGTGKTLVFVLSVLEGLDLSLNRIQAIVLTPTREIAVQVTDVFRAVGSHLPDLKVETFIGGLPLPKDIESAKKCHIAVGAPGRIHQLIDLGHLKTEAVRLFVLDEADQLMAKSFQNDINSIYYSLSEFKQMLALSATYPNELVEFLGNYMRSGKLVTPETDPVPVLKGLKQFVSLTRDHPDSLARLTDKENRLVTLLSRVKFNQCLIFSNYQSRAESTCNMLRCRGWSCQWLCGKQAQEQRLLAMYELKSGRCRLLVTTDLTARGIDSKGIDLVINMDTPYDPRVYLHRMGRAGRYGSHGVVITILSRGQDVNNFRTMLGLIDKDLSVRIIPMGVDFNLWEDDTSTFDELYAIEATEDALQRYKNEFIPGEFKKPNEISKNADKTKEPSKKKKHSSRDNGRDKNVDSNSSSTPPEMDEKHFPPIPFKKYDLNEYFLSQVDNCDVDILSFSDLKDSRKNYSEVNTNIESVPLVNGNIENFKAESKMNYKKDLESKLFRDNNIENLSKSISNVMTREPVRRFSYSDIAKGKRVECKPVDLKPEEVLNLKKSPLKVFPTESVCNKIEGVLISDKAIDAFSKRMYSSVLKGDSRNKKVNFSAQRKSKTAFKCSDEETCQVKNRDCTKAISVEIVESDKLISSGRTSSNDYKKNLKVNISENIEIKSLSYVENKVDNKDQTPSDSSNLEMAVDNNCLIKTDALKEKNSLKVVSPLTNSFNNTSHSMPKEAECQNFENVQFDKNQSTPEQDDNLNIINSACENVQSHSSDIQRSNFYENQAELSRISFVRNDSFIDVDSSSNLSSSDSEGEYIISGSFNNNYSTVRAKSQHVRKPKVNLSFTHNDWLNLYYRQTFVIYNYMNYVRIYNGQIDEN